MERELDEQHVKRLSEKLVEEEGAGLAAYLDTLGILTVGIGHNCVNKSVPGVAKPGDRITPEVQAALFQEDLSEAQIRLDQHFPWWRDLDMDRQCVLIDMCFNMGWRGLATFKNTLLAVQEGRYDDAADGMAKSLWDKQVGRRADFLEEAMRTGVY